MYSFFIFFNSFFNKVNIFHLPIFIYIFIINANPTHILPYSYEKPKFPLCPDYIVCVFHDPFFEYIPSMSRLFWNKTLQWFHAKNRCALRHWIHEESEREREIGRKEALAVGREHHSIQRRTDL